MALPTQDAPEVKTRPAAPGYVQAPEYDFGASIGNALQGVTQHAEAIYKKEREDASTFAAADAELKYGETQDTIDSDFKESIKNLQADNADDFQAKVVQMHDEAAAKIEKAKAQYAPKDGLAAKQYVLRTRLQQQGAVRKLTLAMNARVDAWRVSRGDAQAESVIKGAGNITGNPALDAADLQTRALSLTDYQAGRALAGDSKQEIEDKTRNTLAAAAQQALKAYPTIEGAMGYLKSTLPGTNATIGYFPPRFPVPEGGTPHDLTKPILKNEDGSWSTESTMGITADGKELVIPTIVDGKRLTKEDAIKAWKDGTNPPVGVFNTREQADAYAQKRHEEEQSLRGYRSILTGAETQAWVENLTDKKAVKVGGGLGLEMKNKGLFPGASAEGYVNDLVGKGKITADEAVKGLSTLSTLYAQEHAAQAHVREENTTAIRNKMIKEGLSLNEYRLKYGELPALINMEGLLTSDTHVRVYSSRDVVANLRGATMDPNNVGYSKVIPLQEYTDRMIAMNLPASEIKAQQAGYRKDAAGADATTKTPNIGIVAGNVRDFTLNQLGITKLAGKNATDIKDPWKRDALMYVEQELYRRLAAAPLKTGSHQLDPTEAVAIGNQLVKDMPAIVQKARAEGGLKLPEYTPTNTPPTKAQEDAAIRIRAILDRTRAGPTPAASNTIILDKPHPLIPGSLPGEEYEIGSVNGRQSFKRIR